MCASSKSNLSKAGIHSIGEQAWHPLNRLCNSLSSTPNTFYEGQEPFCSAPARPPDSRLSWSGPPAPCVPGGPRSCYQGLPTRIPDLLLCTLKFARARRRTALCKTGQGGIGHSALPLRATSSSLAQALPVSQLARRHRPSRGRHLGRRVRLFGLQLPLALDVARCPLLACGDRELPQSFCVFQL